MLKWRYRSITGSKYAPPELRAGVIAAPQHGTFEVAELIEHEQRVVTGTLEVPVVGRALLLSIGLADRAIHVEDQLFGRLAPMDLVDPLAGKIHQRREVAAGVDNLRLKAANLTGGSSPFVRQRCSATNHMTHGRIDRQPLGIVHVFIACQSAVD